MSLALPALKTSVAPLHYFATIPDVGLARIRHKIADDYRPLAVRTRRGAPIFAFEHFRAAERNVMLPSFMPPQRFLRCGSAQRGTR